MWSFNDDVLNNFVITGSDESHVGKPSLSYVWTKLLNIHIFPAINIWARSSQEQSY